MIVTMYLVLVFLFYLTISSCDLAPIDDLFMSPMAAIRREPLWDANQSIKCKKHCAEESSSPPDQATGAGTPLRAKVSSKHTRAPPGDPRARRPVIYGGHRSVPPGDQEQLADFRIG